MRIKLLFLILLVFILYVPAVAQNQAYRPLVVNGILQSLPSDFKISTHQKNSFERALATDTLDLPFFDDFTSTTIYPNPKRWTTNQVYINNHFGYNAPTHGMATFDNLDYRGQPYHGISLAYGGSDTLESQGINLKKWSKKTDSLYLSFYLQPQGLDIDPLNNPRDPQDSFFVEFFNKNGAWVRAWEIGGKGLPIIFKPYDIRIKDTMYLHEGFRFRFINTSLQTGNANHWNLDYVLLSHPHYEKDTVEVDIAFADLPSNLLKDYTSLPWRHYLADSNQIYDTSFSTVRNFNNYSVFVRTYKYFKDKNHKVLGSSNSLYSGFAPQGKIKDPMKNLRFAKLFPANSDTVIINRLWMHDFTGDQHKENDSSSLQTVFANYLAYDDGSAECGYGIENGAGKVALEYNLNISDTLWAVGFFFNQSYMNVKGNPFNIHIWKSIEMGGANDTIYKTIEVPNGPEYKLGYNQFTFFKLDTPLILPKGKFYIGWSQTRDFMLNVGFDRNYKTNELNTHLFYHVLNKWYSRVSSDPGGTPMIRAYLGHELEFPVLSVPSSPSNISSSSTFDFELYPNPFSDIIHIMINTADFQSNYQIFDLQGKILLSGTLENQEVDCSRLSSGVYFVRVTNLQGQQVTKKLIKN